MSAELYEAACQCWAQKWVDAHLAPGTRVLDVHFTFEEGHAYSTYTWDNATQEISIHVVSANGQESWSAMDLTDGPSFGELVQQICEAYDEVKAGDRTSNQ